VSLSKDLEYSSNQTSAGIRRMKLKKKTHFKGALVRKENTSASPDNEEKFFKT
jgi:hypothetical protein